MKTYIFALMLTIVSTTNSVAGALIDRQSSGYVAYVPQGVTIDTPVPVLVVLPGMNMSAHAEINSWKFFAEKQKFLVLAMYVNYHTGSKDELFSRILNIVQLFAKGDSNCRANDKIFLAGTSAGGMVALKLALMHPKTFRATAVVSGSNLGTLSTKQYLSNAQGLDFYLLHGRKDNVIPIENFLDTKQSLENAGANVTTYINENVGHNMLSVDYERAVKWMAELQ